MNADNREVGANPPTPSDPPRISWRPARPADLPRLRAIVVSAFENVTIYHTLEKRYGVMGERPWQDWKGAQVDRFFAEHPEWVHLGEIAGEIVAVVTFRLDEQRKVGTIGNNGVDPRYQGKGIGTEMYRYVLGLFRAAGMRYAEVETGLDDAAAPARRAYEKVGFQPLNTSVHYFMELDDDPS